MAKGAAKQPRKTPRNPEIAAGVRKMGRKRSQRATAHHKFAVKGKGKEPVAKPASDRPAKRAAEMTKSKFYPADDYSVPLRSTRHAKPTKLRKSITPGTVGIVLAGRFRGRRVVILKQLSSGLLLVSGPLKINGVPLRRMNAAYIIATSTKVDVSKVDVTKIDDALFARVGESRTKQEKFISENKTATPVTAERKAAQQAVDSALMAAIKPVAHLKAYLGAHFSLTNGQKPHLLKF